VAAKLETGGAVVYRITFDSRLWTASRDGFLLGGDGIVIQIQCGELVCAHCAVTVEVCDLVEVKVVVAILVNRRRIKWATQCRGPGAVTHAGRHAAKPCCDKHMQQTTHCTVPAAP